MIGKYLNCIGCIVNFSINLGIGQVGEQSTYRGSDAHLKTMLIIFLCQRTKALKVLTTIISITPFCHYLRKAKAIDNAFKEIADREITYGLLEGSKLLYQRITIVEPKIFCGVLVLGFKTHYIVKTTLKNHLCGFILQKVQ